MASQEEAYSDGLEDVDTGDDDIPSPVASPSQFAPKRTRGPNKVRSIPTGVGAPKVTPLEAGFSNSEIESLWPEALDRLRQHGLDGHLVSIRLFRVEPPPRVYIGNFDGSAVMGSEQQNPGDAIMEFITDNYHLANTRMYGPARYDIQIVWKKSGQVWTRGTLYLPPPETVMGLRKSAEQQQQGLGRPPQHSGYSQAPTAGYQMAAGNYSQPLPSFIAQPGLGNVDPERFHLQAEIQRANEREMYLRGQLERAGLQPNLPPQQPQASPGTGLGAQELANLVTLVVEKALDARGIGKKEGVAAPSTASTAMTVTPTANPMMEMMNRNFMSMMEMGMKQMMSGVERGMKQSFSGFGAPPQEEEEDEPAPAALVQAKNPEDELPYRTIKLEQKWSNGSDVYFAQDKESGGPNYLGLGMGNPFVVEKGMEALGTIAQSVGELIKRKIDSATNPTQPMGLGQPMHTQPQQFAAPPQQPQYIAAPPPQYVPVPPMPQQAPEAAPVAANRGVWE